MSFDLETRSAETDTLFKNRYKAIEEANSRSFYLTDPNRSFDAYQSVHSYGTARDTFDAADVAKRVIAGGNMSTVGTYGPSELSKDERIQDASDNMSAFFESLNLPETSIYVLNPERDYTTPLTVVDVDAQHTDEHTSWPVRLDNSGDFLYTRDPNKVLAVRPADCPVMIASANTPEGKIFMMVHYAWKGAAHHYVEQTAHIFESLHIEKDSLEIYLTPGGQAESFPYVDYSQNPLEEFPGTEGLFVNVSNRIKEDGTKVWDFDIDTPKFVYDQLLTQLDINPAQVFCDTSDTSALNSGYSSHGRSIRLKDQGESNTRDIAVAVFNK